MSAINMSHFAKTILDGKYAHTKPSGHKETWDEIATRVANSVVKPYLPHLVDKIQRLISERKLMPGGRYLAAAGRRWPAINNCFMFIAEDSREGWADTMYKSTSALMAGGGIGNTLSKLRASGELVGGLGGTSTGPCALAQMVNEAGRHIMQGGSRRSAIWCGLHWWHKDIDSFITLKDWPAEIRTLKQKDFNFPATMDGTNISVVLDTEFFNAYSDTANPKHKLAYDVYWKTVKRMCKTGEPGFTIDAFEHEKDCGHNACVELSTDTDSDMCNLASLNLTRFNSVEEFEEAVVYATAFMLCGTIYGVLPLDRMYAVREKNRRLGLGLMGIHEWLLRRDKSYGPDDELGDWFDAYARAQQHAHDWSDKLGITRSVATRAIAPNGTISIVAETTAGIEPIFATAQKRRYLNQSSSREWKYQYIIDACAQRIIDSGVDPRLIEDSYDLAEDYERRINFQSWVQNKVDHCISSTINMPQWGSSINNSSTIDSFGKTLFKYLPTLRGITVYPDGARGGQPLNRVSYSEAIRHIGKEFTESGESVSVEVQEFGNERSCVNGVCGL